MNSLVQCQGKFGYQVKFTLKIVKKNRTYLSNEWVGSACQMDFLEHQHRPTHTIGPGLTSHAQSDLLTQIYAFRCPKSPAISRCPHEMCLISCLKKSAQLTNGSANNFFSIELGTLESQTFFIIKIPTSCKPEHNEDLFRVY